MGIKLINIRELNDEFNKALGKIKELDSEARRHRKEKHALKKELSNYLNQGQHEKKDREEIDRV